MCKLDWSACTTGQMAEHTLVSCLITLLFLLWLCTYSSVSDWVASGYGR